MGYLIRGEPAPSRPEGAIEPDESLPRACVIGAGSCGIAAAKALYEARIPFDCFEAGPVVGGLWRFENPNGLSGAYSTLEMNTSGPRMSYSDFPIGDEDYPPHEAVGAYFDRYVDHFGIRRTITFNTRVEHVEPLAQGGLEVTTSDDRPRPAYDAILVANGHHWKPRWPEPPFPGHFDGVQMHAHDYRAPGAAGRQAGGGGRRWQQRHGHRPRRGRSRGGGVPLVAPGRARDPQAARPQAKARRPDAGPALASVADQAEGVRGHAHALRRHLRLRLRRARPQGRPRAPDRLRRDPRPARARDRDPEAEHPRACAAARWPSRTAPRRRWT